VPRSAASPISGQLAFVIELEPPPPVPNAPVPDAVIAADAPKPPERMDAADWRLILDFERRWSGGIPAKQRAVRDRFGISSARYHQLLDRALELPEARSYDPALVGRLQRVREGRRRKRSARPVQTDPKPGNGGGGLTGGR
jgi:hypothetical protein